MNCKEAKKHIELAYEGGKITDKAALAHIEKCAGCSAEYSAALAVRAALSSFDAGKVPANFNEGVWQKAGAPAPGFRLFSDAIMPVFKWAGVAAAALVAVILISTSLEKNKAELTLAPEKPAPRTGTVIKPAQPENQAPEIAAQVNAPVQEQAAAEKTGGEKQKEMLAQEKPAGSQPVAPSLAIPCGSGANLASTSPSQPGTGMSQAAVQGSEKTKVTIQAGVEFPGNVLIKHNVFKPLKNERVVVNYKLSVASNVLVRVYDRSGKYIKTIYTGPKDAGVHEAAWDGRDDSGGIAGDGIYLLCIKTAGYEEKIKVVVLK